MPMQYHALTVQYDLIYHRSRVFIPITCRKQVVEQIRDVYQAINALKTWGKILLGGR